MKSAVSLLSFFIPPCWRCREYLKSVQQNQITNFKWMRAESADSLSSTSCRLWLHFDFFLKVWKPQMFKSLPKYSGILLRGEFIHQTVRIILQKALFPNVTIFLPGRQVLDESLGQKGFSVERLVWALDRTLEHSGAHCQRSTFCCTPIKINEAQILQNKDHQQVPGEPFPIRLALRYSSPGGRADNRTPPHRKGHTCILIFTPPPVFGFVSVKRCYRDPELLLRFRWVSHTRVV